jgi:hypothetical protein
MRFVMRRIFSSVVPLALALASTSANAADLPLTTPLMVEREDTGKSTAPEPFPVVEFWQIMPSEIAEELEEFLGSVESEVRAALVPTGEGETGWNTRGVDLILQIEALPGGIANNGLLTLGEVPSLELFGKIPADILADWEYIQAGPKAVSPVDAKGGIFVAISPVHVVFLAADEIQAGKASCMKNPIEKASDHLTVYRYSGIPFDPESDASLEAETEAIVMHSMMGGLGSPVICSIYRRDEEGRLQIFAYTPDGRPLGLMDDDGDRLEIVSEINLYEQLNANYISAFTDDEEESGPAEAVSDPS